jgi:AraC family transcriptional regulator
MQMQPSPSTEWYGLGTRHSPPVPGRRLFLSSADSWNGFRLDLIDLTGPSELPERSLPEHVLVVHVDGPAATDIWYAGQQTRGDCLPGDVCVVPARTPYAVRRDLPGRIVAASLDTGLVQQVADEHRASARVAVEPRFSVRDPLMTELVLALTNEVLENNPSGRIYAETLGSALAAQLIRRHGIEPSRLRGGLSKVALQTVAEYIEANLAAPLPLQDLASLAGMSGYQFARRFKRSTGLPPHQYVLRRRIERARDMLRLKGTTVLEVALSCGFSNQSHFTSAFRLLTGVTPSKYREVE